MFRPATADLPKIDETINPSDGSAIGSFLAHMLQPLLFFYTMVLCLALVGSVVRA